MKCLINLQRNKLSDNVFCLSRGKFLKKLEIFFHTYSVSSNNLASPKSATFKIP